MNCTKYTNHICKIKYLEKRATDTFGRDYSLTCQAHSIKLSSNSNSRNELANKKLHSVLNKLKITLPLPTGLNMKIDEIAALHPDQKDGRGISRMLSHLLGYSE